MYISQVPTVQFYKACIKLRLIYNNCKPICYGLHPTCHLKIHLFMRLRQLHIYPHPLGSTFLEQPRRSTTNNIKLRLRIPRRTMLCPQLLILWKRPKKKEAKRVPRVETKLFKSPVLGKTSRNVFSIFFP